MTALENPLLKPSPLPHKAVPFHDILPEHFLPALDVAIAAAKSKIDEIKNQEASPTFENTIVALETAGETVDHIARLFFNLNLANTNDQLQALSDQVGPKLSAYSSDILLDEKLFARVKAVYEQPTAKTLSPEEFQLLDNTYQDFSRNGANLSPDGKTELRRIDEELSRLGPKFSENVLKATNAFAMVIEREEDLKGLPDSVRKAAALAAEKKGHSGKWVFTLHHPSYEPFLKYADNRALREKMWRAQSSRSFGGEFDNQEILLKIVRLRHQRAQLLGFKTYADYILRRRMAETPEKVEQFLHQLLLNYKPAAQKDLAEVQAFASSIGGPNPLQPWDFTYYAEKYKEKVIQISEEDLRPYFPLDKVVNGVFENARRLYGLTFKESREYPVYHPDVKVYEVTDQKDNSFIGLFYVDFFPRASKSGGGWMTNYLEQGMFDGEEARPHVSIVCNFTQPLPDKPSLLNFREVRTLFHEFGHSLHSLLSKCKYRSLSGTNVFWDFVELPSQVMENWTTEKESLNLFARHYETDAPIPDDLVEKIKKSSRFLAGYMGLRQLNMAFLDMAWFNHDPQDIRNVADYERQATQDTRILPEVSGANISCSFTHIFPGGYSAGYYSYKWAEVLDADAFEMFKEKGLYDREVATRFRDFVLARGGTEHPMELYKKFRGREPDPQALFRREGFLTP